jgi:glycosyltransferase involved in cell wall biosynthesis
VPVRIVSEQGLSLPGLVRALRPGIRSADVVHAHRYKEVVASVLAMVPARRPLVVTVHGLEPAGQLGWGRRLQIWGALWLARLAGARFVAVSRELELRLGRVLGADCVERFPNPAPARPSGACGFDLRRRIGWHADRRLVGFVGRLEPVKGPDLLLEIASLTRSDLGFVFVGEGSLEAELEARVRELRLADRVSFVGAVSDALLLLDQLDALALPSRHEGLPMVLLEAAVVGIPVVAFDVGGVSEVLDGGPAAALVPGGDLARFARALERATDRDDILEQALARWAALTRERFSLRSVSTAYRALYGRLRRPAR